jgi:hypothetical protein
MVNDRWLMIDGQSSRDSSLFRWAEWDFGCPKNSGLTRIWLEIAMALIQRTENRYL